MANRISKNKIAIVIPYFGKLPVYFNVFLKGCTYNTDLFDVLLFTDIKEFPDLPSNVQVFAMSMSDVKKLAEDKFGFKVSLEIAYKLCDFKPTYGLIFQEYLKSYDFWGFGDIDLIYGDISKFITPDIIDNHDVISLREEWIAGPFTLIRNNDYLNNLCRESKDFRNVFMRPEYLHFDECGNKYIALREREPIEDIKDNMYFDNYVCFTSLLRTAQKQGLIRVFMQTYIKEALAYEEMVHYTSGRLFVSGWGILAIYHMVYEKGIPAFKMPHWEVVPDNFFVGPTGFYKEWEVNSRAYWVEKSFRKLASFIVNVIRIFSKRTKDSLRYRMSRIRGKADNTRELTQ